MSYYTNAEKRDISQEHVRKFVLDAIAAYHELIDESDDNAAAKATFVSGYVQACVMAHYGFWRPYNV